MKKLFAVIISVAMILSMGALFTSALDVVGDINITWDAEASSKLNLNDGDISDWATAGYEYITLGPSNFHAWTGTIPETFAINCYFVADADNLYVGFWINDSTFVQDTDGCDPTRTDWRANGYWGDAFQIAIDFNSIVERWCDEEDMDFGNNKNIFYSFASYGNGAPITIVREETYNNNGYLSEANGDDVSGSTNAYEGGWCAEFSLSWQMLYDDCLEKTDSIESDFTWNDEKNLTVGITLCYIDHAEAGATETWAGGTFDNTAPGWLATDNGIHLQLAYEDGRTINCSGVEYPGKGNDPVVDTTAADTTAADTVADTTAPETTAAETTAAETTAAATTAAETTAAATTAAETTAAPAAATTAAATTAASGGCGSVVGAGAAVVVLSAIVAGAALSKKRD